MKFFTALLLLCLVALAYARSPVHVDTEASAAKPMCPCGPYYLDVTTSTSRISFINGQTIFACSDGCASAFTVNMTASFLDNVNRGFDTALYLGTTQHCPISGAAVVVTAETSHVGFTNGQAVFFCCDHCLTTFLQNVRSFIVPTVRDPVSGVEIVLAETTPRIEFLNAQSVNFTDATSLKAFLNSPQSYINAAPASGVDPRAVGRFVQCPVSNQWVEVAEHTPFLEWTATNSSIDFDTIGQQVYFADSMSAAKFAANPSGFIVKQ